MIDRSTMEFEGDHIHVFIDTSTLEKYNFNLDHKKLQKVFGADEVIIHTTKITLSEISTRMVGLLAQARDFSAKALNRYQSIDWRNPSLVLQSYRKRCDYTHDGKGADLGRLIELFIDLLPPFSKGKPDEFKDAAAAISLHYWAKKNGKTIHVISEDKDWVNADRSFDSFKCCKLSDIVRTLHSIQRERDEFDGSLIETAIEESDDVADALELTCPNRGEHNLSTEVSSANIRVKISKAKVSCSEISVIAAFSGNADVVLSEWGEDRQAVSVSMSGFIEAILDKQYKLKRLLVTDWFFPVESLRFSEPDDDDMRLPGDQS